MGSPIAAMLAQAAPAADGTLRNEDAERDARIKALLAQVQANQQADPSLMPQPAAPSPAPTPAPAAQPGMLGAISNFLMSLIPSTKSLAQPGQAPAPPPTPEQLAARNRAISGQQ